MDNFQQRVFAFLKALTAKQIVLLAGSALIVGGTIWVFVQLLGQGEYKPLYSGMAPADAQSLAQRLSAQNISYRLSTDGTAVLVRSDQLDKARVEAASQGPLASGRMGFELFDKPNWSGSDFSEKVNYQRALEAELERTIQTMSGVEAVRVHLVLPRESLFTDRERVAKAAVVLKLRGTRLNDQISTSVANLVSSAWDDLSPQNVTVVTTDGQMPGHGHDHRVGMEGMEELETTLAERIVRTLTPVVGNDHVKSSVTIDYDPTSADSTQELYDPNSTAVLSSQSSQETVGDLEPAGIPGTPSNAPSSPSNTTAATQAKAATSTQGIRSESKTFAVSHTTRHLLEPAGRVKRVAAAILVDDAVETTTESGKTAETRRKRTPEEMKQIEELAKAAIGFDSQRGDQFSLQNISFSTPQMDLPLPPGKLQRFVVFTEHWTGALRYVALSLLFLAVYLLILRPVKKHVFTILESTPQPALSGEAAALATMPINGGLSGLPSETGKGVSPEVEEAISLKKKLALKVKSDPQGASRLIQNWLRKSEATR
jgi:flagellar M-ring protein FliF